MNVSCARPWLLGLVVLLALSGAACSESGGISGAMDGDGGVAPDDLAGGPDLGPVYPAAFPAPAQGVTSGGPVLAAPRLVPVFFANDDAQVKAKVSDFMARVGATAYWKATTSEYGVGPASAAAAVTLAESAPDSVDEASIAKWLTDKLNAGDPQLPAADANTLYVLFYPSNTTISAMSMRGTNTSCIDYGGYHADTALDARHGALPVAYAVIPRCGAFGNLTGLDVITGPASHELVEAATDPYPSGAPAYNRIDDNHRYWRTLVGGGELGDMCESFSQVFVKLPGLPYTVQRTWSNAAARAGHDPCVPPLDGEVYFNSVPELDDTLMGMSMGGSYSTLDVQIPVGQSKTITLDLFSDAPTAGPWTVRARDAATLTPGGVATLAFAFPQNQTQASGQNGDRLQLTITVLMAGPARGAPFVLTSKLGVTSHTWYGLVSQ